MFQKFIQYILIFLCSIALTPANANPLKTAPENNMPQTLITSEDIRLHFPVDCDLGQNCWLMNLPDTNPEKERAEDFQCGPRSYDTHNGTDFAVRDKASMEETVYVLAAANGTVTRLRDGEEDKFRNTAELDIIRKEKKECGNGIVIDHGNGWQTQYCHLKKGSIAVEKNQTVRAGQKIAAIGMSGITEHPHLHITVRKNNQEIDPFTNKLLSAGCSQDTNLLHNNTSLWQDRVPYEDFALYDAGFAETAPDFGKISQGIKPADPIRESTSGVFWFVYFGARKGDLIAMTITTPSGQTLAEHDVVQDKDRARQYYFTGRKLNQGFPERGLYKGTAKVTRITSTGETKTESIVQELEIK